MCNQKVALVTGGSGQGIGRSTAILLAQEGFNVVINYKENDLNAQSTVNYIKEEGYEASMFKANIFDALECKKLFDYVIDTYGRIDLLYIGPGADFNIEDIRYMDGKNAVNEINQELVPIYELVPLALKDMSKRNWGRIIAIGTNNDIPSPSFAYNHAKKTRTDVLLGMTKNAWVNHITINVIAPGPIDHYYSIKEAISDIKHFDFIGMTPLHVANIIRNLAKEESNFITGNEIKLRF